MGLRLRATEVESASLCSGAPDNWPIPTPEEGSDLQRVLATGEFWCGFPTGLAFASEDTGMPFIDSMDSDNTTGYIVDYWVSHSLYCSYYRFAHILTILLT